MKKPLKILGIVFLSIFILIIGAVFAIRDMVLQEKLKVIHKDKVKTNNIGALEVAFAN